VVIRAILFDLGNTLISYYTSGEFPLVLRRCLRECARAVGQAEDHGRDEDLFERALLLNRDQSDFAVRPLAARLQDAAVCRGVLNDIIDDDRRDAVFAAVARALRPHGGLILDVRGVERFCGAEDA
jgi:FMN phosphatase YigB (HAD superfamily)